jgi:hypothetical protein
VSKPLGDSCETRSYQHCRAHRNGRVQARSAYPQHRRPGRGRALQICRTIAQHLDYSWDEVLLDNDAHGALGGHPWDKLPPVVLDISVATELGYRPVGDYATTVAAETDWLVCADDPVRRAWPV